MTIPQNTGILWRDPQPEDDKVGGQSRVALAVRLPDGKWLQYNPDEDYQVGLYGDTSGCTDETCTHSLCMQGNWMLSNNKIPADKLAKLTQYGFIKNGKLSLSPRFNYIKAGTKVGQGNFLYKPWDSARNDGMIPYDMLPFPYRQQNPPFTMEMYADLASITPAMEEAAKAFLEVFVVQYEIVPVDDASQALHLQHAPLAIITGVCKPWDGTVIPACGINDGHAMCRNGLDDQQVKYTFDSYSPCQKRFAWDYPTKYAIKGVLLLRDSLSIFKHFFSQPLSISNSGDEVKALQIALFLDGTLEDPEWPTREHVEKWGGYFGEATEAAVKRFQHKYGITPESGLVFTKTNTQLNLLFN